MSMIEGPKANEITTVEQIDHKTMQEFLSKLAVWDYYEMTKEKYTSKSEIDKKYLIIKYYNALSAGIICYLLSGVCSFVLSSGFCSLSGSLFGSVSGFCSTSSGSGLMSMERFFPVKFDIL